MIWIRGDHGLGDSARAKIREAGVVVNMSDDDNATTSVVVHRGHTGFPTSGEFTEADLDAIRDSFDARLARDTDDLDDLNESFAASDKLQGHIDAE